MAIIIGDLNQYEKIIHENLYQCKHCGKWGLPSAWTFITKDNISIGLITECANELRHRYGDGANMTIWEK